MEQDDHLPINQQQRGQRNSLEQNAGIEEFLDDIAKTYDFSAQVLNFKIDNNNQCYMSPACLNFLTTTKNLPAAP